MKVTLVLLCTLATAFAATSTFNSWRIVGGANAADGQFPHQISLRRNNRHSCGGSILDATTILCAAHCVTGASISTMSVSVGSNQLDNTVQVHQVKSYVAHEDYNPFKIQNDIAILKLRTPIEFGENVQAIALPDSNIEAGQTVVLSGWGTTSYPGSTPNDLQFIELKTISVEDCAQRLSSNNIIDSEVCTLTQQGEGACHGDSGGPLITPNGVQIGIVSWGRPCARGYPDVFTRVHSFLDWIARNRH